jgi:hypothetical protein
MRIAPLAILLYVGLVFVYNVNGTALLGNDTRPARYVAVSLLKRGDFNLDEFPALRTPSGELPYYVVQAPDGHILSRYGFGVPAAAAPAFAFALAIYHGKLPEKVAVLVAKLASSLCVAGAAVLLLLTALRLHASRRDAMVVALSYGLASCAFSVVSQALWQHGPAELFLTLGIYLLVRDGRWSVSLAGAAFAAAAVCRTPAALFALAALVYVAWQRRRALIGFVLAALPLVAAQAAYNTYYFGAPWHFPQAEPLGVAQPWGHSMLVGLPGLLVSPSRGLFVYTPIFLFLLWRPLKLWQKNGPLVRCLLVATLALILVFSNWWAWHGGWSYGYRLLVDAVPVLVLALLPRLAEIWPSRAATGLFLAACAISLAIHAAGAYCYDNEWDHANDIEHRPERAWAIKDGQLAWTFTHLSLRRWPGPAVSGSPDSPAKSPESRTGP